MSTCTLLVDFGASRVKSALWSNDQGAIIATRECISPLAVHKFSSGIVEVELELYWKALEATAGELLRSSNEISTLWLCTEMHGVAICSANDGSPLTPYISWRDERAKNPDSTGLSTYDHLSPCADIFLAKSGMKLKSGLPFLTLAHLSRTNQIPASFRLHTLADWLLWRGGERNPGIHSSLAAGTGFFDINTQLWSPQLVEMASLEPHAVQLPRIVRTGNSIGRISLGGRSIDVYGGLGDMQAAAHGANFPIAAKLIVNLGTGSQVLGDMAHVPPGIELRPGVSDGQFSAITHIPSCRAITVFAKFLDSCTIAGGGKPFFWEKFSALDSTDVLAAPSDIDMNVFDAAWRYQRGGGIYGIHENSFSLEIFLATLAKSWLTQYATAIELIDPAHTQKIFLLSGGLSRRANFILPVLEKLIDRTGIMATMTTEEETLDGLLNLSQGNHNAR